MSDSKRQAPKDIAIVSGPTDDGQGARVLRIREGGDVTAGEIRPLREGEAVNQSEVVRLHPLDSDRRVCEVEVLHAPAAAAAAAGEREGERDNEKSRSRSAHPERPGDDQPKRRARVSTDKYRKNWSAIFESNGSPAKRSDWSVN